MIRTKCISMFLLAAGSFVGTQVAGQTDPNRSTGRAVSSSQRKSRSEAANETFQSNDRNEDGVVTKDEAYPIFLANFDKYDVNNDGRVELGEFQKTVSQTVFPAARQRGNGDEAAIQWVTPVFSGPRLQHRVFKSEAVKCDVSYHIYVPEIYGTDKTRSFPVLYWLHGGGGPGSGSGPRPLSRHFDNAIGQGKTPPMLVVFPNGLRARMWCDSKDGRTPIETILINELIPDVDANFRTIASREGRMIEGFSGGGYGAARLGFKHHGVFSAVSILGGGPLQRVFSPSVGPKSRAAFRARQLETVFGGDQEYYKAASPWFLAEKNAVALRDTVRIRQMLGEQDFTLPANRDFDAHLTRLNIPHTFRVVPGVDHSTLALFKALGEENWKFYLVVFGSKKGT